MGDRITAYLRNNVLGFIAIFIALGAGAYAAGLPKDSVKAKQIRAGAINSEELARNAVTSPKVANGALLGEDFAAGQLPQGPQGEQGLPGERGLQGEQGLPGEQGLQGASGWSADCNEGLAADDVMVRVGSVCVDKYESSIWDARTGGNQITGAIPCNSNGQNCTNIYARSVAGVVPRANITWFQAQQALANSGKRLPSNADWQMAVAGTPDSAVCTTGSLALTGQNTGCVSSSGASDMIGNLWEWVADWVPRSTGCGGSWHTAYGSFDYQCLNGAVAGGGGPGALLRGGDFPTDFDSGQHSGPLAVFGQYAPSDSDANFGFRGAR